MRGPERNMYGIIIFQQYNSQQPNNNQTVNFFIKKFDVHLKIKNQNNA